MVWDQGPGVALGLGLFEDICQAIEEGVAVLVIAEELSTFDSPCHYMLQDTGSIKSWLAWHLGCWKGFTEFLSLGVKSTIDLCCHSCSLGDGHDVMRLFKRR